MFTFHAWLTVRLPVDEGILISGLLGKGYDISAAAANSELILVPENSSHYAVFAFKLQRELATAAELYDDLIAILTNNQFSYYSLVISEFSADSIWNAGNVNLNKLSNANIQPKKKTN